MEHAVELRDVTKRFQSPEGGEVTAVDRANLQIKNGEFFSLLGPSGCGKTTSLRMVAGFEWPTSGDICIDGEVMGRTPPFMRPANTVFQSYALFQHMTVFQNVAFGLEMERTSKSEIKRRVEEALDMVKLSGLGARRPKQLSGGQQQRVALARALIKRPAVLLLDEPLGALDLKLRKEMQLELKALQVQVGITFIYVTHDQEEALTMSDRIAVMNKGKILQIGSPIEIYERPSCRFVADFIGQTNFLTGVVRGFQDHLAVVWVSSLNTEMMGLCLGEIAVGQAVSLSIRPEKMRLADHPAINMNNLHCKITHSTYIGSDTRVTVDAGGEIPLVVWEQNKVSMLEPSSFHRPGQEAWVILFPENVMILPEE
jgi:spermidine/putrescine transport system ATP-binding protein